MRKAVVILIVFGILSLALAVSLQAGSKYKPVPVYQYWNPTGNDHFYTQYFDEFEYGHPEFGTFEQVAFCVLPPEFSNGAMLYRYWNPKLQDHYYTVHLNVYPDGTKSSDWVSEGNVGQVLKAPSNMSGAEGKRIQDLGLVPLYCYYNQEKKDHYYTLDKSELGDGTYGWKLDKNERRPDGIECYVLPKPKKPKRGTVYLGLTFFNSRNLPNGQGKACGYDKQKVIACFKKNYSKGKTDKCSGLCTYTVKNLYTDWNARFWKDQQIANHNKIGEFIIVKIEKVPMKPTPIADK